MGIRTFWPFLSISCYPNSLQSFWLRFRVYHSSGQICAKRWAGGYHEDSPTQRAMSQSTLRNLQSLLQLGNCQNYGPFLGTNHPIKEANNPSYYSNLGTRGSLTFQGLRELSQLNEFSNFYQCASSALKNKTLF